MPTQVGDSIMVPIEELEAVQRERDALRAALEAATAYIDANVCDQDTTPEMWQAWVAYRGAVRELEMCQRQTALRLGDKEN